MTRGRSPAAARESVDHLQAARANGDTEAEDEAVRLSADYNSKRVSDVRESLLLLFVIGIVFLAYSNTFTVPFIFDDKPNIQNNPGRNNNSMLNNICTRPCCILVQLYSFTHRGCANRR